MSLRSKFIICFTMVVVIIGMAVSLIGIHFIQGGIVREAQKRVELDLYAAREIYKKEINDILLVVRLTANNLAADFSSFSMKDTGKKLCRIRVEEGLDILTYVDRTGVVRIRCRNPGAVGTVHADDEIVAAARKEKKAVASTTICGHDQLAEESRELADRSHITIIPTPMVEAATKAVETSGMVVKAAVPVIDKNGKMLGVLYGGTLLNRNYTIVDKVTNTVFKGEAYKGKNIGTATIFQGDLRVSTNVVDEHGNRAIGTRVSHEVSDQVLRKGKPWIARAFVVNDWYLSAYEPITNLKNEVIGMLYVGILEQKYTDLNRRTLLIFLGITFMGAIASLIVAYVLSRGIIRPIQEVVSVSTQFAKGNFDARVRYCANNELGELGKAFNTMAASIADRDNKLRKRAQEEVIKSERMAMIGQLSAGVAHEINNPLGSILLFTRILLKKSPSEGIFRDNLERIEKDVKRCQNIVQGLLEFARQREPHIEMVYINDLIDKTVLLFENQPNVHNIGIIKNFQPVLPPVSVDPSQIQQVFVNIVMNAIDAMGGKGTLTIGTRYNEEGACIEIAFGDTGCGIPPEIINRIFEPFFTTKGTGHGTGLGLSISYGIIQRHGGELNVRSTVGKGSTFTIILPVSRTDA